MSAELLRQAATILRERAEDARDVTGASDWFAESSIACQYSVRSSGGYVADATAEEEAAYIATMHPGVGLALADWLGLIAWQHEMFGHNMSGFLTDHSAKALNLARLIVGEAS